MRIVGVKFRNVGNVGKVYHYFTKVPMRKGWTYNIIADGVQSYTSPVTVVDDNVCAADAYPDLRTITKAAFVDAPKPKKTLETLLKRVVINEEKGITTFLWKDGRKTQVRCQEGDKFDPEKGILLCLLKRCFDDRGFYNDWLRKVLKENGYGEQ